MKIDTIRKEIVLDTICWSFSSVNTYATCPYNFYLHYIEGKESIGNAFAEWGSLVHKILEDYFKGKVEIYELCDYYKGLYSNFMEHRFPFRLEDKYYEAGEKYLANFNGFSQNWEVVGIEEKVQLEIDGNSFVGYIDLVVKDKDDGKFIIIDHKSKNGFKNKEEEGKYARQLYLYSLAIKEKYGEYPKKLILNMFRTDKVVEIPFNEEELKEAQKWFTDTINQIKQDTKFLDKIKQSKKKIKDFKNNDFFCNELCGCRYCCKRAK